MLLMNCFFLLENKVISTSAVQYNTFLFTLRVDVFLFISFPSVFRIVKFCLLNVGFYSIIFVHFPDDVFRFYFIVMLRISFVENSTRMEYTIEQLYIVQK